MDSLQNTQYNFEGQNSGENVSSDTLYLKQRFKNNLDNFNNTIQGLKQCMEQINRNDRDNSSNQKIDKIQRVEQMLLERRNKLNITNTSQITMNTDRFNNQNNLMLTQTQNLKIQSNPSIENNNLSIPTAATQNKIQQNNNSSNSISSSSNLNLQKFQQFQNIIEPEEDQFDADGSSFLRGGQEELIKQKIGHSQYPKEVQNQSNNNNNYQKTDRDSLESNILQNDSQSFFGMQRLSDLNELKAQQFLQEVQDEDSIALPEYICKLFPESSSILEKNRLSEIERDFNRKSYGSNTSNQNYNNELLQQKEEQNYRSSLSSQYDPIGKTQLELDSAESSAILKDLTVYQFYSNQQHALSIEDRLYVKNLSREERIKQLQESQQQRIDAELQKIPKISKQSEIIAKNSQRFQENPDLIQRLMTDKLKKEQIIRQKQSQQMAEDEHRFTFAPQINQQSVVMNRSIENLYQWDQKRKIKQNQTQKQHEIEQEETLQKMKQSNIISEGSKKIIEQQTGNNLRVEDRLIREGQSMKAKKQIQQEKENQMIRDMSNRKGLNKSNQNQNCLSSVSKLDETSQINTTNKMLTKQYSTDKLNNSNKENKNHNQNYIIYQPNSFQNYHIINGGNNTQQNNQVSYNQTNSNNSIYSQNKTISQNNYQSNQQYSSEINKPNITNENNSQDQLTKNQIQNYFSQGQQNNNFYQQPNISDNYASQKSFRNNTNTVLNNNNNINNIPNKINQQEIHNNNANHIRQQSQEQIQQRPTHQKTFSLHVGSQQDLSKIQQQKLAFPLNAFKQSEKIILPKSLNGKVSVESLIQSAQFRKTKIFASDSQNLIILDKTDNIPLCKNPSTSTKNNNNEQGQIIDINSILHQRQESVGKIRIDKIDQYNSNQNGDTMNNNRENMPYTQRQTKMISKQSSQTNLVIPQQGSILNQQNNLFFQQIKNEKNTQSYSNQFQKRKLQRTNSCLTSKYFSSNR